MIFRILFFNLVKFLTMKNNDKPDSIDKQVTWFRTVDGEPSAKHPNLGFRKDRLFVHIVDG
jgi:hypothetical protein